MDTGNGRVQKWWPGAAYGMTVVVASMSTPYGLTFDNSGNIVIADTFNHRVITFGMSCRKLNLFSYNVHIFLFLYYFPFQIIAASTTTTPLPSCKFFFYSFTYVD